MPINQSYRDVHLDVLMSGFSFALWQDTSKFVGTRFFGTQNVNKASDKYKIFPAGYFNRQYKTRRAEEGVANSVGYKTKEGSYSCDDDALRIFISDRKRANADSQERLDQSATRVVTESLLIGKELEFRDKFLTAGKWSTDYVMGTNALPTSGTTQWTDPSSEPVSDIIKLKEEFLLKAGGNEANRILATMDVYNILREHPAVLERIGLNAGATTAMPAQAMRDTLAQLFEVDEFVVMQSIVNVANDEVVDNDGHPVADNQFAASGVLLLAHVAADAGEMSPTAAATFVHSNYIGMGVDNGPAVRRYPGAPGQKGEYIEAEMSIDQKLVAADLGMLITNIGG